MLDINKVTADENAWKHDPEGNLSDLPEWSEDIARQLAAEEDIELREEHWEVIHLLRNHYRLNGNTHSGPHLLRALEEPFGARGGRKYLYQLFPRGPIVQGSKIGGLPPPPYGNDPSFGSVE